MIRSLAGVFVFVLAAAAAETPLLNFVPPEAKTIGGINVERTVSSPLGRFLLEQVGQKGTELEKFVEATGFDPRRDVRELVFASLEEGKPHKHGLIVARGVFNGPSLVSAMEVRGGTVERYKGVQLVRGPNTPGYVAFLGGSLAVAGTEALVKGVIDGTTHANGSALRQKAAGMAGRYDAWVVATGVPDAGPARTGDRTGAPVPAAAMKAIEQTSAGLEFGSVVRLTGEAVARTEKDAEALVDVYRFLRGWMQLNGENNPRVKQLQPLLDSLEVRAEDRTVHFSAAMPEADLEDLIRPRQGARQATGLR